MEEIDLYLRKSKIVREGVEALTFQTQEDRGRAWADQHGYRVRKVWKDNLSAWTDTRRPEFDLALAALKRKEVPALWCYAVDRFSRKGAGVVAGLLDAGTRLIFDYERLDSADPRDRERIIMDAERAKSSSDLLSYRVRDTKDTQRRKGVWLAAAPYGLRKEADGKLHHAKEWCVVLRILEEIGDGTSARTVARGLTADGIPSPRGGSWGASTIRRIVANPVYEGWQVVALSREHTWPVAYRDASGKRLRVMAADVDPVPAETVERARRVQAGHQRGALGTRVGRASHLLTDLLRCAGCGSRMPTMGRSYVCNGHAMGKPCPAPASAMRQRIEDYVFSRWFAEVAYAKMFDPLMIAVAERWAALTVPEASEEAREAIAAVKAAEAAIEQLANDRAAGLYNGTMGKHFPRLVSEAEETLRSAQENAASHAGLNVDLTMFDNHEMLDAAWEAADTPLRRDLLRVAIDEITVTQASRRGAPFDGDARCDIRWAQVTDAGGAA
ncbi:recombinase family protein [Streptomyces xanthophaeus]|uniref:recombinase family protein n=1 Tax=Streptomyces xanthophaeus TaxID=67385 RepID=UPI00386B5F08|nr:recombinase family protein [Streptomyces xanthophaeus]WST63707.1 recombinase family protein [Streptomyces xanthophaeus]